MSSFEKNLVVLEHPMLFSKFEGHRPFCSGAEEFLRRLPHMGMATILVNRLSGFRGEDV